ncbi:MAG TPA: YbjQ family protein [Opitutaceae bacterium]|nr:YbjQ family protein [Opitutaceae bacterium]
MHNTTAFSLTGFRVTRELGTVRGVVVRSRSVVGSIGASFQTLFGGDITLYTELCEHARRDAFQRLCSHADSLGANAVIGLRYDATEISPGVTEVLCYGTAVTVTPDHA